MPGTFCLVKGPTSHLNQVSFFETSPPFRQGEPRRKEKNNKRTHTHTHAHTHTKSSTPRRQVQKQRDAQRRRLKAGQTKRRPGTPEAIPGAGPRVGLASQLGRSKPFWDPVGAPPIWNLFWWGLGDWDVH